MWHGLSQPLPAGPKPNHNHPRTKAYVEGPGTTLLDSPFWTQHTPHLSAVRLAMASQRLNQTPPRGKHLRNATILIALTWVPNKKQ